MSHTNVTVAAEAAPKSLLARFFGIITSPQATYRSVVAHPKWFGMMALIALSMALLLGGFLYTNTGQNAWLDAATTSSFRGPSTPEQLAAMEKIAPYAWMFGVGQMLFMLPLIFVITGGILFAIFNAALGGTSTFKQLFAVVVHSSAVSLLGQCFTMPINYLSGTMSSSTNLAVLLPMIDDASFLGRLLGMVDLFIIWWLIVLAIGLGVLYRRRTQPIAVSLMAVYAVIAVVVAIVRSRMGGA